MEKGYLWLVIVAALNSVVSLFYYLLVLRRMYISEPGAPRPGQAARLSVSLPVKGVLLVASLGIFWLGILPGSLMSVISDLSVRVFAGR
jgi:NADH-quinone oxidoreductase subunit N